MTAGRDLPVRGTWSFAVRVLVAGRLVALLALRPGRQPSMMVLPVVGFAMITVLLLTVLAGASSLIRWQDEAGVAYRLLAGMALVVLGVPLLSLGVAVARLSARRRDARLATLRLLGATPGLVQGVTVLEAMGTALVGAAIGVLGYLMAGPAVSLTEFRGEPIGADYWLPAAAVGCVLAGVGLLAAISAVVALRRVVISPLGVLKRHGSPPPHWGRVAGGLAILGSAMAAIGNRSLTTAVTIAVVFGGFALSLAMVNLTGPWLVGRLAQRELRRARTPARLLAARIMGDAPKVVWRQVAPVAMAAFVAVVAGSGAALSSSAEPSERQSVYLSTDIRTGVLFTLASICVMVACSTSINQAAEVLDRADLYRALAMFGTPFEVVEEARTAAVMVPVVWSATGSAACSALLVLPLAGTAVLTSPLTMSVVLGSLVGGVGLLRLALLTTRPLLRSMMR